MTLDTKSRALKELEMVDEPLKVLLPQFYSDRIKELTSLEKFQTEEDWESIRIMAHTWKGFCKPYGFSHLGLMAAELEQAVSPNPDQEKVSKVLESINFHLGELKDSDLLQADNV